MGWVWRAGVLAIACAPGCGRSAIGPADGGVGWSGGGWPDDDDDDDDAEHDADGEQLCREVDFLFVIDDSASMASYQENLASNYGVFIDGIREAIDSIDTMHIGVITTEPYPDNVQACEGLGGLIVSTGGPGSSDRDCGPYRGGENFMTDLDPLDSAFRCAATVGTGGSDHDAPLASVLAAISPPLTDPGSCNHGFVGQGALLVVVIVSDSYPSGAIATDVDPYFAGIGVAEAMGDFDDVVVVVIASTEESPCLNPLNPALADFAGLFDHSFIGAICAHDYTEVFAPAVEVVKAACPS